MKDFLGFRPKRSVLGSGGLPDVTRMIIANSTTIREGGAMNLGTGGAEDLDGASEDFLGYCVGFEDKDGFSYDLRTSGFAGASASYTQNAQGDTHASSSDNTTAGSDGVVALIIPALGVVCSGYLDEVIGSNTGDNLIGYYLDIDTTLEEQLDGSSASTTKGTWFLMPGTSGRLATDPEHPETTRRVMVMGREIQQVTAA